MGKLRVKGINLEVLAKYAHGLLSNPLFGVSEITVTNDSGPSRPRSSHTNRSWHQDIDLEAPTSRRWPNGRSEPDFIVVDDYHPEQYALSGYPTYTQPSHVPVARSNSLASRGQQEPDRHYHGSHRSHTRLGVRTYQREDSSRADSRHSSRGCPESSRRYDNDDRTASEQSTRLRRESRSSRHRPSRGHDADIHHQPPELHTSNQRGNNHYERTASDLESSLDSPMDRHGRRSNSTSFSHNYHSVREAPDPRAPTQQHAHTQMRTTSSQHSLNHDHDHMSRSRSRSRRRDHRERHVPPSPGQASHRSSADSGYASGQRTPGRSRRRSRTSSSSPSSPWRGRDHRDGDGRSRPPIALDRADRRAQRWRSGSSGERNSYRHH